jgi:AcrR family transcriptional regulator
MSEMTNPPELLRRPPGRPRNEDADREIVAATLRLLAEQGYDRTSMEAVAAEADVTRATVYRRYASKAELVCAALSTYPEDVHISDPSDVRGFLVNLLSAFREGVQSCDGVAICSSLYLNRHEHPEMLDEFRRGVVEPRRQRMGSVLESAIAAGQVRAGVDVEMIVSMLFGAGIQHMLTGHTLPPGWPERAVAAVWPMLEPGGLASA